jgi:hypothetical protein
MSDDRPTFVVEDHSEPIRPETLLPYSNPRYEAPRIDELRATLAHGSLTPSEAGLLLGVPAQTVASWASGEQTIPYAAWRLLLIALRLVDGRGLDTIRVSQLS